MNGSGESLAALQSVHELLLQNDNCQFGYILDFESSKIKLKASEPKLYLLHALGFMQVKILRSCLVLLPCVYQWSGNHSVDMIETCMFFESYNNTRLKKIIIIIRG